LRGVIWLRILVLLIDLYVVLSLGAWFALRFAQWRAQRSRRSLVNGAEALLPLYTWGQPSIKEMVIGGQTVWRAEG